MCCTDEKSDFFVLGPPIHTFFRGAAIVMGAYVLYKGNQYDDNMLRAIGGITIAVDAFTFCKSIQKMKSCKGSKCSDAIQ
jgi:hypothetical protein